ncbi:hypothetical protein LJR098_000969 [Rhizobium sp. LjRoot98]|nr:MULTISPECIES: hypothetical protein [unclassified Rhizobium]
MQTALRSAGWNEITAKVEVLLVRVRPCAHDLGRFYLNGIQASPHFWI